MSLFTRLLSLLLISGMATTVLAKDAQPTYWDELIPNVDTIDDPFSALNDNQMFDIATIARFEDAKKQSGFVASESATQEIADIKASLAQEGVDVDYLFEMREQIKQQRQQLATQPNQEVLDAKRKIPGFITPIEMDSTKVTKFFLVPSAGACIHTPPPPANQLVLVDYPDGIELVSLSTPVWVEGDLLSETSVENVNYADGAANVESVYTMQADEIELYSTN
jgi:hypothetical protein